MKISLVKISSNILKIKFLKNIFIYQLLLLFCCFSSKNMKSYENKNNYFDISFKNNSINIFTIKKVAANKVAFVVTDASDGTIKFILFLVNIHFNLNNKNIHMLIQSYQQL
jgi:hypothetical protein